MDPIHRRLVDLELREREGPGPSSERTKRVRKGLQFPVQFEGMAPIPVQSEETDLIFKREVDLKSRGHEGPRPPCDMISDKVFYKSCCKS